MKKNCKPLFILVGILLIIIVILLIINNSIYAKRKNIIEKFEEVAPAAPETPAAEPAAATTATTAPETTAPKTTASETNGEKYDELYYIENNGATDADKCNTIPWSTGNKETDDQKKCCDNQFYTSRFYKKIDDSEWPYTFSKGLIAYPVNSNAKTKCIKIKCKGNEDDKCKKKLSEYQLLDSSLACYEDFQWKRDCEKIGGPTRCAKKCKQMTEVKNRGSGDSHGFIYT